MTMLRRYYKLALSLLIGSGLLACTYAAYDARLVGHVWGTILHSVGLGKGSAVPKERVVAAVREIIISGDALAVRPVSSAELEQRLAWATIHLKDGWLSFAGQTLESVVAEFNQHNARQLVIGDEGTRRLRVGGKFRVTDIDGFLAALTVTHGVKAVVSAQPGVQSEMIVLTGGQAGSASLQRPAAAQGATR